MKKILLYIFIAIMSFSLVACGGTETGKEDPNKEQKDDPVVDGDLLLGSYQKELECLDGYVGQAVIEAVHRYINANAYISKLADIDLSKVSKEEVSALLNEALDNWDGVLEIAALANYLEDIELNELYKNFNDMKFRKRLGNEEGNNEAVEWAKAITKQYDAIQGNQKLKQLSEMMGTDAKSAYKTLCVAQDILNGEYAQEEERAGEWLAVLEATKTASKVGVFLCATTITCGTTALSPAGYLTAGEATGIMISGVDVALTISSSGANIILGEDSKTAKKLSTVSDAYSTATFVYGIFNKPETVGETIAFIGDAIELTNKTVSYAFKVDPLAEAGSLVTNVIDTNNEKFDNKAIEDLKLGGAYKTGEEKTLDLDNFIDNNKQNIVGEDIATSLELSDKAESIVTEYNNSLPEQGSNVYKTERGLSYKEYSYNGYRYRNSEGYLDGECIQFADGKNGRYICADREYDDGVCVSYKQYFDDSTIMTNGYYDSENGLWVWEHYEDGFYPGTVKGALKYIEYNKAEFPDKNVIDEYATDGYPFYNMSTMDKIVKYDQESGRPVSTEFYNSDGTKDSEEYEYVNDEMHIVKEIHTDLDNTVRTTTFDLDGRKTSLRVVYEDGTSDGESYTYGHDDDGDYIIVAQYTNGEYVGENKQYEQEEQQEQPMEQPMEQPVEQPVEVPEE